MNFFNRAIKNVTRKWSKSILLLITFFVIGNFVIVGLGVSQASESAKTLTRQKMRAVVTYSIDHDAINKYTNELSDEDEINKFYENYPKVTLDDVRELLKDESVIAANATYISQAYQKDGGLDFVKLNNQAEENMGGGQSCYTDEEGNEVCTTYVEPRFSIKGNFFPSMIEFVDKEYNVVEGSFYTQEDIDNSKPVCLISEALAELNGIHVGDSIEFYSFSPSELNYFKDAGITIEDITTSVEVIGIYSHNSAITPDSQGFDWTSPYENPDNMILMPASSLYADQLEFSQKMYDYNASQYPEDPYFQDPANRPTTEMNEKNVYINNVNLLLDDPLKVDGFVEKYSSEIGEFKMLDANNEEFERLAKPLDTLSLYANFIVWLVVINAIVIITLVTALTLKTREYEIGVLLSIGASKMKIVAQFFVELALVAIIGFTLSIVSGSLIANKVGATVLDYQIATSEVGEQSDDEFGMNYPSIWNENYATEVSLEDLVSEYNVSISPLIIGEIYVVGLGIVLISILIPSMMIMRFNPKKILMNQN